MSLRNYVLISPENSAPGFGKVRKGLVERQQEMKTVFIARKPSVGVKPTRNIYCRNLHP